MQICARMSTAASVWQKIQICRVNSILDENVNSESFIFS